MAKKVTQDTPKPKRTKISGINFAGSSMGIMIGAQPTIIHSPESKYDQLIFSANREQLIVVEHTGEGDGAVTLCIEPPKRKVVSPGSEPSSVSLDSENPVAYISTRDIPNECLQGGDYVFNIVGKGTLRVTAINMS